MKLNPETLARSSARHPWRAVVVWVIIVAAMGFASSRLLGDALTSDIAFTNRPESLKAQDIIEKKVTGPVKDTEFFLVRSDGPYVDSPEFAAYVGKLRDSIKALGPKVVVGDVTTYYCLGDSMQQLMTPDGHGTIIPLQLATPGAVSSADVLQAIGGSVQTGFQARVLTPADLTATMQAAAAGAPQASAPRCVLDSGGDQPDLFVLVTSATTPVTDPAFQIQAQTIQAALTKSSPPLLAAPPMSYYDLVEQQKQLVSRDGQTTLIPVTIQDSEIETVDKLNTVIEKNRANGFQVLLAGGAAMNHDSMKIVEGDLKKSESTGLLIALVVLVIVFGALIAALLPIVIGLFVAIPTALGGVALLGKFSDFSLFTPNFVSMLGLAVGIDYSLFIVSRYREERRKGKEKIDAIGASGATASRAVFFSGVTVVVALLGMFIMPTTIFRSLASGAILVVLAAVAATMTLLPAMLGLLGDRINWPRLSKRARMDVGHDPQGGFWDKMTRGVMRAPVVSLLASVVILGALASAYFGIHKGTAGISTLPNDMPSKRAFLMLEREFAGGQTDPIQVVVQGDVNDPAIQKAIATLRIGLGHDPALAEQTQVIPGKSGDVAVVNAYFNGDPMSNESFATVRRVRSDIVPKAFAGVDATVLVGGNPAFFTDFLGVVDQYTPLIFIFVLGLSFLLLTVVFRSIVVPAKAILMNLLSVGAAYGAIVLVFQHGVGISFFNKIGFQFQKVEAIEAWLPLFLFSILFGLSMDYHVFLLTRIREEYDKTGDNAEAVAYGLRTTAGIITGAAIIMVAVFTAFASGRMVQMSQMGFGLAVAVFMDATIVRSVLVPSSMRLLGDINWYLPKWLQWLPKLNVEGATTPAAEPEMDGKAQAPGATKEVARVPSDD